MSVLKDNMIVANALNYAPYVSEHGVYQYQRITQNTGGTQAICSVGGGNVSTFELPVNVYNYGRSYINYMSAIPAVAGRHIHAFVDGIPHIQRIRLFNSGQKEIARIDDFHKYSNMLFRREIPFDKMMTFDRVVSSVADVSNANSAGWICGLVPINDLPVVPAGGPPLLNPDSIRYDAGQLLQVPYIEPKTCIVAPSQNTPSYLNWRIPLSHIMNTILAIDKDLYLGSEVLYLEITWNASTKVYCTSLDANFGTPNAAAADVTLSNLELWMAVEKDEEKRQQAMAFMKSGQPITIPYVYAFKQNLNTGVSQTVSVKYSRGNGSHLKALYYAPYNNVETNNTAYDKYNINDNKILEFYVEVNGYRTAPNNFDTSKGQDYLVQQQSLKGSCILTSENYYFYNTFKLDFNDKTSLDLPPIAPFDNLIDGVSLASEVKVDFYTTTANNALNHYIYAVTTKQLKLSEIGVLDQLI